MTMHTATCLRNVLMHVSCSGTQHQDCARLSQRLQAAAKQVAFSSKGKSHASAAACGALVPLSLLPDRSASTSSGFSPETLLTVHTSQQAGRQLAVAKDVAAGSVMWKEQPHVHLLLKQHRKQVFVVLPATQKYHCLPLVFSILNSAVSGWHPARSCVGNWHATIVVPDMEALPWTLLLPCSAPQAVGIKQALAN